METLKIARTVQPDEQLTLDQWKKEFFAGARLKPEVQAYFSCPLESYLKFIDNAFNQTNS